jgi:hypothetical protein
VTVKYHPKLTPKIVHCDKTGNDYLYYRGLKSRITYEAFMNDMSFKEYKLLLDTGAKESINKLKFLPNNIHVHHEDEDFTNNAINNLRLIDPVEHGKLHASDRMLNLSFVVDEAILTEIVEDQILDTYDLKCAYPNNNYIAEGFVVHNCGKNYMLYRYFAQAQKNYGERACLAMACFESFIDKHFAQTCGCKIAMSEYDVEVTQRTRESKGEPPLNKEEIEEALSCPGVGTFHIFAGPAESVLDGIIEAVSSNVYQIIGIDSWDSMLTAAEDRATLEEIPQVASPATIQTRWAKKVLDAFNVVYRCPKCGYCPIEKKVTNYEMMNFNWVCSNCEWKGLDPDSEVNETTVYCIRQVRAKLQMGCKVYGRAYKADGAYAIQHLNHIRVSMHPGSSVKDGDVKIGKEVNWEISKAKAGAREGMTGSFTLFFDPVEIDVAGDMFAQCLKRGVIQQLPQGWLEVPEIEMDGKPLRVHGKDKFISMIESEETLVEELRQLLYVKAGLSHVRFQ